MLSITPLKLSFKALFVSLIIISLLSACSGNAELERKIVSEQESIAVAQKFLEDIFTYNDDHDIDLTTIEDYSEFWSYLEDKGLSNQLSSTLLAADSTYYEWQQIAELYYQHVKPLINFLFGYRMDDLVLMFDETLGAVDIFIPEDKIGKGLYISNDPSERVFTLYVEQVKGESAKVVSIYTTLPATLPNKYGWVHKDVLERYLAEVRAQIVSDEQERARQERLNAEEEEQYAQMLAELEEEHRQANEERLAIEQELETARQMETKCSQPQRYEDQLVRFNYDSCTTIEGSLASDSRMTISSQDIPELSWPAFTIDIQASSNDEQQRFEDFDTDVYDMSYYSLFGENSFVAKTMFNEDAGETMEKFEGITAEGEQIIAIELRYKGDIRPTRADTLLFVEPLVFP